jgi:hypothetical protein
MGLEAIQFDERSRVKQQLGTLTGREFSQFMLLLDFICAPTEESLFIATR